MTAKNLLTGVAHVFRKRITFDGTAGKGAVGTVLGASVTGGIAITRLGILCRTLLLSAGGGNLSFGPTNAPTGLIAATVATAIDENEWWVDTGPDPEVAAAIVDKLISENLIFTVDTGAVTAGVLDLCFYWHGMTKDARVT